METYDPKKSATEARGGNERKMNLRVLLMSMVGIIVLFVIIYIVYSATQTAPA